MNAREERVTILVAVITVVLVLASVPWIHMGIASAKAALAAAPSPETWEASFDEMKDTNSQRSFITAGD